MASTVRVRGYLDTADGVPAAPVVLYKEGTDTVITVGAADILSIDSLQVAHATAVQGKLFFSTSATLGEEGVFYHRHTSGHSVFTFPVPVTGQPGETVYCLGADGENMHVIVTGEVYVS